MVSCSKKNTPRECSPKDLLETGASAPLGIALFLYQKFTIFMMGVYWESSDCRNLFLGLQTRFTPVTQSIAAFRAGLASKETGKDYAPHIQHSSSHQSATPQNPNPFNSITLHAHQGCLPFAFRAFSYKGGVA